MTLRTSRRTFMANATLALFSAGLGAAFAQAVEPAKKLKPGEWSWYPERSESGPVAVIVSLTDQLAMDSYVWWGLALLVVAVSYRARHRHALPATTSTSTGALTSA